MRGDIFLANHFVLSLMRNCGGTGALEYSLVC